MLKLDNVFKTYQTSTNEIIAINDFSYEFGPTGFYCILGKSGCGKSTLINILSGLDIPDKGNIFLDDNNINLFSEKDIDQYHAQRIGIIFQSYNLIPELNVFDNLRIVTELHNNDNSNNEKISLVLDKVQLKGYEKRKITELSGGEQQRVAIARALLKCPDIILADEPTGNLDSKNSEAVLSVLSEISKTKLVIMVTHDEESSKKYADHILYIKDGHLEKDITNYKKSCRYSFDIVDDNGKITSYNNILYDEAINTLGEYLVKQNFKVESIKKEIPDISKGNKEVYEKETYTYKFSKKYLINLAYKFVNKKKVRMFFSCLIFTLTFILLYFSVYLSFYDEKKIMVNYLKKEQPGIIPINTSSEYTNDFFENITKDYTKGELLYHKVKNNLEDYSYIVNIETDSFLIKDDENLFSSVTIVDYGNPNAFPSFNIGRQPNSNNEIAITDYIASELNLKIGDTVSDSINEYTICGIIETDYLQYGLKHKLSGYDYDDNLDFLCKYKYFVCYTYNRIRYNNYMFEQGINLPASSFMENNIERFICSNLSYSGISNINEIDICEGRLPKNENEIVISYNMHEDNKISIGDMFAFKNLYEDTYSNSYNGYLNLYDYYKNGIVVVGILNDSDKYTNDVYINDSVYKNIYDSYYNYYKYDLGIIPKSDFYNELVNITKKEKISLIDNGIQKIESFKNTINEIKPILFLVLAISIGINIMTINTFIGISIDENKKNIAIMRSLGITTKDCSRIFIFEYGILFLNTLILTVISIAIISNRVNILYSGKMNENNIKIIAINIFILVITSLVELFSNYFSIVFPIKKLKKRTIAEIIK